ncbi:hypothetical protein DSO57_1035470 [Entomophthora muscae]|uniref:Uncharacterized protein n=1 Tax=Entomophthora muscae TaxID=34485 RepID=A0ACC2TAJ6_9FUNG|nr:hypothetical protein DSO57_1035470 [Entomophthora muscae]
MSDQLYEGLYIALAVLTLFLTQAIHILRYQIGTHPTAGIPTGPAVPRPRSPNASTYAWIPTPIPRIILKPSI